MRAMAAVAHAVGAACFIFWVISVFTLLTLPAVVVAFAVEFEKGWVGITFVFGSLLVAGVWEERNS